jgi:hypothetical protein
MIRFPERWQVANTLSGEKAFPGDVWQRTDESAVVRTNERNDERGESSNQFPAATRNPVSLVTHDASRGNEQQSAGAVRQAAESFVAVRASRFEAADREQSGLTCARRRRSQRPDAAGGVIHSASGFDTGWLVVRATADSMAGERPALRVAHRTSVAVELQTSRRGVSEFKH